MTIRQERGSPSSRAGRILCVAAGTAAAAALAPPHAASAQGTRGSDKTATEESRSAVVAGELLEITSRRIDQLLAGFATEQAMRRISKTPAPARPRSAAEVAAMGNAFLLADSVGSEASGLKPLQYVALRERVAAYLAGPEARAASGWSYAPAEVAVLEDRARDLAPLAAYARPPR